MKSKKNSAYCQSRQRAGQIHLHSYIEVKWISTFKGGNIESHRSKTIGIYEKIATVCHTNLSENLFMD